MHNAEKTAELLENKRQLFARYEEATVAMLEQPTDTVVEKYITEREDLANRIDILDEQIASELAPWGKLSRALLIGHADVDDLPDELRPLHGKCGEIMEIVRRIRLRNKEALSIFEQMRDESERRIRDASNLPKINRYLDTLSGPRGGNNFGSV